MINVALVSNTDILISGLSGIISDVDGIAVTGIFRDLQECLSASKHSTSHVVIVDTQSIQVQAAENTPDLIGRFRDVSKRTGFIAITQWSNMCRFEFARQIGFRGFCIKTISSADLIAAIQVVAQGKVYMHSEYTRQIALCDHSVFDNLGRLLGKRQLQILNLILQGFTNSEIADLLYISVPTVKSHTRVILKKLGHRDRTQVVAQVLQDLLCEIVRNESDSGKG